MPYSPDSASATSRAVYPATVNDTMPTRGWSSPHRDSSRTPSIEASPERSRAISRSSSRTSAVQPVAVSASQAAARAMAPSTLGVPASCLGSGSTCHSTLSPTERTAPPPLRYGSPSASQSLRPTSAPAPKGAYSLCPEKAT